MKTQKNVVEKIILYSEDNSHGVILSKNAIKKIVSICYQNLTHITEDFINQLLSKTNSSSGYLINSSDLLSVLPSKIRNEWDEYTIFLEKIEKEINQINYDFEQEKINYNEYRNRSYDCLSRFVYLCESKKWTKKNKFKYYKDLWWNCGYN